VRFAHGAEHWELGLKGVADESGGERPRCPVRATKNLAPIMDVQVKQAYSPDSSATATTSDTV
jgi:hypothetical protein